MVARAVDVVVYQRHFDEENARRVAEVLEVDRPGVSFGVGGEIGYRFRRLVGWDSEAKNWVFPVEPSPRLRRTLELKGLSWPATVNHNSLDDRTEPDAMDR
jgi:hypothetical protein